MLSQAPDLRSGLQTLMFHLRRARGAVLRLVRHRALAMALGLLLAAPSAWLQFSGRASTWWVEGLCLVVGATGMALIWTGLTGVGPDWQE
jgi:hypothetical protein